MLTEEQKKRKSAYNKEWRARNKDKLKGYELKRRTPERKEYERQRSYKWRFGISQEEYNAKREAQGHKCSICGIHEEEHKVSRWGVLCLDHDHVTGQLRDFLCAQCNKGLGSFNDSPELLRQAAEYLEKFKNVEGNR